MGSIGPVFTTQVIRLANAIKKAEGSNVTWNNPGDLTYAFGYPVNVEPANAEGVLKFVYPEDGWTALCHECDLMLNGRSKVYELSDTLAQVGQKYAHGDPNWGKNVAEFLGVPETTTLLELAT